MGKIVTRTGALKIPDVVVKKRAPEQRRLLVDLDVAEFAQKIAVFDKVTISYVLRAGLVEYVRKIHPEWDRASKKPWSKR